MLYTYDSWKALIGRLQQMQTIGTSSELASSAGYSNISSHEGDDYYGIGAASDSVTPAHHQCKTLAGVLTLRGQGAGEAGSALSLCAAADQPLTSVHTRPFSGKEIFYSPFGSP